MRYFQILIAFLALIALATPEAASAVPIVRLRQGAVMGAIEAGGVESFKGLPYAAPPVGPQRWRAPVPAENWRGLRSATAFAKDCIQEPQQYPPGPGFNNPTSEDCLYLNLWRPAAPAGKRLPVMVWIHGGAFIMGAGSYPIYDGAAFAREGVILVTVNYRLGRFGMFAHPALTAEDPAAPKANFGLLDQIAALRWVQGNIGRFGGDPTNVTLFGESAGAVSVNLLMGAPLARGLFARAIIESGPARGPTTTLAQAETAGKAWAATNGASTIAQLRALSADQVWDGPVTTPASPILDGKVVVETTEAVFRDGRRPIVPFIIGFNSQEESLLRWLPGSETRWFQSLGARGPALLTPYEVSGEPREKAMARLWGEATRAAPARALARAAADHGGKVWLYRYGYVPDAAQGRASGAGHDAEIEMVFKNPDPRWPGVWSKADNEMARIVNGYWVNFAKTGSPNGAGLTEWPTYSRQSDTLMAFGPAGAETISRFGAERLDAIDAAAAALDRARQ